MSTNNNVDEKSGTKVGISRSGAVKIKENNGKFIKMGDFQRLQDTYLYNNVIARKKEELRKYKGILNKLNLLKNQYKSEYYPGNKEIENRLIDVDHYIESINKKKDVTEWEIQNEISSMKTETSSLPRIVLTNVKGESNVIYEQKDSHIDTGKDKTRPSNKLPEECFPKRNKTI
ncbi:MAG: hypothetical protein K6D38_04815 [Pseudobutyrivibrio sp.]|nr:hypothetical protein [Pseudobutyrivibrio sp.]